MQTKYTNVVHQDNLILALDDETNKKISITKSTSPLYVVSDASKTTDYRHLSYKDKEILGLIESFIRGTLQPNDKQALLLSRIVVRFGWLDKTLGQLQWVPLVDLVDDFVNRNLGPTEKGKFQEICKMLSLSIRESRKLHIVGDVQYRPKKLISNIIYGLKTAKAEVA